jgi:1,4-dihydroxy-2-naphthoate octaprenyltransferase
MLPGLAWLQGNPLAPRMLGAAVAMGYVYQGPPFRWSYLGLGEPLCFLAFGPLATCAFYFAQVPPAQVGRGCSCGCGCARGPVPADVCLLATLP